jgi:hypothetical protein
VSERSAVGACAREQAHLGIFHALSLRQGTEDAYTHPRAHPTHFGGASPPFPLLSFLRALAQDPTRRPTALEVVEDLELCHGIKLAMQRDPFFLSPMRRAQTWALLHQRVIGPCQTTPPFALKVCVCGGVRVGGCASVRLSLPPSLPPSRSVSHTRLTVMEENAMEGVEGAREHG